MQANDIASAVLFFCLWAIASVWDIRKQIILDSLCVLIALTGLLTFYPAKLFGILLCLPFLIAALIKEGGMGVRRYQTDRCQRLCSWALGRLCGSRHRIVCGSYPVHFYEMRLQAETDATANCRSSNSASGFFCPLASLPLSYSN